MNQRADQNISLFFAVIIFGFSALVAQVFLMRELIVIFYGNELSLGTILGVWLLWTAVGSGLLSKLFRLKNRIRSRFALTQIIFAIQFPFTLFLIRWSKSLLNISLGEMIGYIPMLLISFLALAPVCLLSGCLYTLSCYLNNRPVESPESKSIGRIYFLEAIGSGLGGIVASFIFIRWFKPADVFWILFTVNLISAIVVGNFIPFKSKFFRTGWMTFLLIICILSGLKYSGKFQNAIDRMLWKGFDLVTSKNTIYGNLAFTRMEDQFNIFENGLFISSVPDPLTAEESVHFTLLEHPHPKEILLIGGNIGGSIREILRHPTVSSVDYVELDPEIIRLSKQILPSGEIESLNDSRVAIHHIDGRRFVQKTDKKFDAVILNLPAPYTAQLNRFYTLEFFSTVNRILKSQGLFSLQLNSSENAIGPELSQFLSTIHSTLNQVFQDVVMIPGETVRFIGTNQSDLLTSDPRILIKRLSERKLETRYVREYFIPHQMSRERQEYLKSKIHPVPANQLNRDFKPVGYFYDTVLWTTYFTPVFKKIFIGFAKLKLRYLIAALGIFTLFFILMSRIDGDPIRLLKTGTVLSLFNVGFTEISLEMILILGFQIIHGYVYYQMALLIACYMTGLALGSRMAIRKKMSMNALTSRFIYFQGFMTVYPILLSFLFGRFQTDGSAFLDLFNSQWAFSCYMLFAGWIGGYQFPLANRLYSKAGTRIEKTAGFLYSMDLTGSSMGALMTSAFLIPIFGIHSTLLLLAFLNGCSLALLITSRILIHQQI
jgi:spermidine synthase